MHLGTYPPIIEHVMSDQYRHWRLQQLHQLLCKAKVAQGYVSTVYLCRAGKHRSTAMAWISEVALRYAGYRVGYQHLCWYAQDGSHCQRSTGKCWQCHRKNPELDWWRKRVVEETKAVLRGMEAES